MRSNMQTEFTLHPSNKLKARTRDMEESVIQTDENSERSTTCSDGNKYGVKTSIGTYECVLTAIFLIRPHTSQTAPIRAGRSGK